MYGKKIEYVVREPRGQFKIQFDAPFRLMFFFLRLLSVGFLFCFFFVPIRVFVLSFLIGDFFKFRNVWGIEQDRA